MSTQYVYIPVPAQHAPYVHAVVAELDPEGPAEPTKVGNWADDDLRLIPEQKVPSMVRITKVMDSLASTPDDLVPHGDLAKRAGLSTGELNGAFSGFTRWIKSRWHDDDSWPIARSWGASTVSGQQYESCYSLDSDTAARWMHLRGHS